MLVSRRPPLLDDDPVTHLKGLTAVPAPGAKHPVAFGQRPHDGSHERKPYPPRGAIRSLAE